MKYPSLKFVSRINLLTELSRGLRVLNLGCADITRIEQAINAKEHVHHEISKVTKDLIGIDINQRGLDVLRKYVPNSQYLCHSAESLDEIIDEVGEVDVVIAGELIEHLNNPGLFLSGITHLIKKDGTIVITTPNPFSIVFFLHLLFSKSEISSEYHKMFFSIKTLRNLLISYGFTPVSWYVSLWHLPSLKNRVAAPFLAIFCRLFPQFSDTIICVAKRDISLN